MTHNEIIENATVRYEDLKHKGLDWRSFYNGFLEGVASMPDYTWHKFPENEPPEPELYLVIKKDKGHGSRLDRMRWSPFTPASIPAIREITHGWSGNYGSSVTHWAKIPDMPKEGLI
jgi:hypothetical protein